MTIPIFFKISRKYQEITTTFSKSLQNHENQDRILDNTNKGNKVRNSRVTKSCYEIELTQNEVTLRITNSKIFIEILLSSY